MNSALYKRNSGYCESRIKFMTVSLSVCSHLHFHFISLSIFYFILSSVTLIIFIFTVKTDDMQLNVGSPK